MKRITTTIAAFFVLSQLAPAQPIDASAVFEPFDGRPVLQSAATPEMISPRWVKPRLDVLDAASADERLLFEFGDGVSYIGVVRSVTRRLDQCYTIIGSLDDTDGYFIISREKDALSGIFHAPSDAFLAEMRFAGGGAHWLYAVDESQRLGCADSPPPPIDRSDTPHQDPATFLQIGGQDRGTYTSCPPSQPVHDCLVAYTDLSRAAAGGTNAIRAKIQTYVAWTSVAYFNSSINLRMRLVHCDEVVYDEVVPPGTEDPRPIHLSRLYEPSDGYVDEIHAWRDAYNADLVMLLLETSYGGMSFCCADESHAFAIMHWNNGSRILAHEFGHNQGCDHDPENASCGGCNAYSRAHVFDGDDAVSYGTILSYQGLGIPYFSNPNVLYQGQPTGVADQRDNARTIRERRETVENFHVTRFDIWVDFSAGGLFQFGTPAYPYAWLTDAVDAVPQAECFSEMPQLWIEAGATQETLTINKPMVLNACGGTVQIGG